MIDEITPAHITGLTNAIRSIAHGSPSGPTGLEMVAMAIAGDRLDEPLSTTIDSAADSIAGALTSVANSIDNLATAIRTGREVSS